MLIQIISLQIQIQPKASIMCDSTLFKNQQAINYCAKSSEVFSSVNALLTFQSRSESNLFVYVQKMQNSQIALWVNLNYPVSFSLFGLSGELSLTACEFTLNLLQNALNASSICNICDLVLIQSQVQLIAFGQVISGLVCSSNLINIKKKPAEQSPTEQNQSPKKKQKNKSQSSKDNKQLQNNNISEIQLQDNPSLQSSQLKSLTDLQVNNQSDSIYQQQNKASESTVQMNDPSKLTSYMYNSNNPSLSMSISTSVRQPQQVDVNNIALSPLKNESTKDENASIDQSQNAVNDLEL
ncbi:Hypothetical_protein [Hexamita inflata]|uniref:Hypothetical_protein n=1 Tax=Hexamita inflata TaxID=28002 RepID=A0AA86RLB8_9EUKA|nr:Hypothetical protein HINF_LOCUS63383 [Hexamita inflata]